MDNEKKIEIPFGAFDSELIHQEINIPNGFKAVIDGNKIILTKAESEDEKVRKALFEMVHDTTGDELWVDYNVHKEEALAWLGKQESVNEIVSRCRTSWYNEGKIAGMAEGLTDDEKYQQGWHDALEKQGEQKPSDKIKPKFKVGDWVVNNGHSYLIADIDFLDNRYLFEIGGYTHEQLNWEYIENVDNKYHLWTIQDAKDGDVLVASDKSIFIYDGSINENGSVGFHIAFTEDMDIILNSDDGCGWEEKDSCHPSTKEQRDLLFQKMHEAGYEWDADKKELKKISQRMISAEAKEAMYDKPAWSEEDEKRLSDAIFFVREYQIPTRDKRLLNAAKEAEEWLKSLKERVGG